MQLQSAAIERETETAHIVDVNVQTLWVEMDHRERKREREAMQIIQVFPIWGGGGITIVQLYKKLEIKQKFLLPKNTINISHIAFIVNVQFEKTVTAGTIQVHAKEK